MNAEIETAGEWREVGLRLIALAHCYDVPTSEIREYLGTKPSTFSEWISGNNRLVLDAALRLCDRFNITLEWLYRGSYAGMSPEQAEPLRRSMDAVLADPKRFGPKPGRRSKR